MTIISEIYLYLPKAIFMLKHSVKQRRYIFCGDVAACRRGHVCCVLCRVRLRETEMCVVCCAE